MGEEVISVRANFHTHNYRCGHAEGDVEDYVKEAIKEGYSGNRNFRSLTIAEISF